MDQKPLIQQSVPARFAMPSSLTSVPGTQLSQQHVLPSNSLQSPTLSVGKTLNYPTATTPNQSHSIKVEPGVAQIVADTSGPAGTTISIKDETMSNTYSEVDRKPELNSSGGELSDVNSSSSGVEDGGSTAGLLGHGLDVKSDAVMPAATKAPVAMKGEPHLVTPRLVTRLVQVLESPGII